MCPPLSKDEYYPVFLVAGAQGQIMAEEGEGGGGQLVTTISDQKYWCLVLIIIIFLVLIHL